MLKNVNSLIASVLAIWFFVLFGLYVCAGFHICESCVSSTLWLSVS